MLSRNTYICGESVNLDDGDLTSVGSPFLFLKHFLTSERSVIRLLNFVNYTLVAAQ